MIKRWFCEHPKAVGESYTEHCRTALGFASDLLLAGGAAVVHALLPTLFKTTASETVARLHQRMHSRNTASINSTGTIDIFSPPS